jgi:hypothetical protein
MKLFNHFFYWGMLMTIGDGSAVHPPIVGTSSQLHGIDDTTQSENSNNNKSNPVSNTSGKDMSKILKDANENDVEDGNNIEYLMREIQWLRMEGKHKEADLIDKQIWKIRAEKLEKVKKRYCISSI